MPCVLSDANGNLLAVSVPYSRLRLHHDPWQSAALAVVKGTKKKEMAQKDNKLLAFVGVSGAQPKRLGENKLVQPRPRSSRAEGDTGS